MNRRNLLHTASTTALGAAALLTAGQDFSPPAQHRARAVGVHSTRIPGLVGTFETALPDQDPFHRHSETIWPSGHTFAYQVPQDMLPDGEYRWRIRVEDGTAVSDWSAWCSFTVRVG